MRSVRTRAVSLLSIIPALALGVASLTGSLAPADAATVRPAAPNAPAGPAAPAAPDWRAVSAGADGPVAPPAAAATVTNPPSIPTGSGPIANGTFRPFSISDKVSLRVDVGSGDALLTTSDIAVPEISSTLTLGVSYNSLLVGSGEPQGAEGYGWRQREGVDVQLYPASSDNSVTLVGEDGTAGKFTAPPSGSNTYGGPAVFHATLTNAPDSTCPGSAYELRWHQSGAAMCFNSSGIITSETDRNGNTTTYNYCGCGHESSVTYTPKGVSSPTRTVTASYTGSYLTGLSQNGGAAGTRNITYNVNSSTGNLTSITQADGSVIQFGYDSSHDLISIQNYAGNTTNLTYNSAHQVTSVSQSAGSGQTATTRFDYVSSTKTQVADPNTNQSQSVPNVPNITYTIDASTALVSTTVDQAGNTRSATFNNGNNLTSTTGAISGENASYSYTPKGGESLASATSPTGAVSTWTYGNSPTGTNPTANFQPSASKDAQGNASAYTYDGTGDLQVNQNALAAKAKVSYNSDGTPATSTAPAGGVTNYSYTDGNHELNKVTPPSGGSLKPVSITYDGLGRVSTVTDGDGNTVTYTYDLADRILKAAYTGGSLPVTVTYTYDGAGNTKTQADATGTATWTYDPRNLTLTRTDTAGGGTLSYVYDLDGNMTSAKDANGTTSYVYDERNLLTQMTDPAGSLWQFAYDADGRRTRTWFDTNAAETTWAAKTVTSYDASGHISQIVTYENSNYSDVAFNTSYCYSTYVSGQSCGATGSTPTGLLQYATNNISGTVSQYTYDKGNRLTKATNVGGKTFSYGYDSNGNLTSGAFAGSLSYNADNQISSSGYSYDGAGNMTADNVNGPLTYNDAEQMVSASNADSNGTEHFSYAGTGMSQLLSDGTASGITYGLAGAGGQPWVQSYTNGISPTPIYVLHDQQGTPLGMEHNGNDYFFITDNLGSVVDLVFTSGTTSATYNWDPYGHLISQSGGEEDYNLTRYTGGLADPAFSVSTGLPGSDDTHLGDRWQAPKLGAFMQQDSKTVLDDPFNANSYAYAADNPVNYVDPTGHGSWFATIYAVVTIVVVGSICGLGVLGAAPTLSPAASVLIAVGCAAVLGGIVTKLGP